MRVGFVGGGFNAWFHCRALAQVRGVTVTGVCAPELGEPMLQVIDQHQLSGGQGLTRYDTVQDMCLSSRVDVVMISCPNYARVDTVRAIRDAVVDKSAKLVGVICEKPLGRNFAEATLLCDLIKETGLPVAYFENQVHMPSVILARQQLALVEKQMGGIHLARSAEEHGGPHSPWFWDPTLQGGGVFSDMGCHSLAVGMEMCTPTGRPPLFLEPWSIQATMQLLKWGLPKWKPVLAARGVDYDQTPAEDYAMSSISFSDPETGQIREVQATDSWMYDAPGLRLLMEAIGPGYSYTVDSLNSPVSLFVSDDAAAAVADAEMALEKAQSKQGKLVLQPNEADLYGYVNEWVEALAAFRKGQNGYLDWGYGRAITALVMGSYLAHEQRETLHFQGWEGLYALVKDYVPKIQQGKGWEVL